MQSHQLWTLTTFFWLNIFTPYFGKCLRYRYILSSRSLLLFCAVEKKHFFYEHPLFMVITNNNSTYLHLCSYYKAGNASCNLLLSIPTYSGFLPLLLHPSHPAMLTYEQVHDQSHTFREQ